MNKNFLKRVRYSETLISVKNLRQSCITKRWIHRITQKSQISFSTNYYNWNVIHLVADQQDGERKKIIMHNEEKFSFIELRAYLKNQSPEIHSRFVMFKKLNLIKIFRIAESNTCNELINVEKMFSPFVNLMDSTEFYRLF